ncbi:MAG: histidinol-phosphate aminotransferase family protein [Chloroflexi bacterium]|nr:MAG: histidinol-phosphate aminotransferase family protein [Chloroflexota bacterium]
MSLEVLRLGLNESPYGPSPLAVEAMRREAARPHRYPDPECSELRGALARHHGVTPDMVAVGHGSPGVLAAIAGAFVSAAAPAILPTRTWPIYRWVMEECGAPIRWAETPGYRLSAPDLEAAMARRFGCCFVCTPHNPCGTTLTGAEVRRLLDAAAAGGGVLAVDEAYGEYTAPATGSALRHVRDGARCLVLKTFSKVHGLAGIRVAYAVGPADLVARLREHLPVFAVTAAGQAGAVAALADEAHVRRVRAGNERVRTAVLRRFEACGLPCPPSEANFVLVPAGVDGGELARRLREERLIEVVDATPLGFPGHVRVGLGRGEEMARCCAAVAELVEAIREEAGARVGAAR